MKNLVILILINLGFTLLHGQRNTILIIADDLSPDYFGFYENHKDTVDVPNLRKLVRKGVRFTNLMSNPVCSSTRATILTGRYSFRTRVGGIVGGIGGSNQIDTSEISIPKLLKIHNAKIAKANIGKWHLKQAMPAINLMSPLALGYDWFQGPFIGQLPSFTNWTKYSNGISSTVTTYATTENVNDAVAWLKTLNKDNPFFLWLAFNAPHEPLHLPPNTLHNYSTLTGTMGNINAQPKEYFKAMIQAMDHEMGRLFDSLQTLNKLDSTDIIFIGDNGNTMKTAQIGDPEKAKGTIYQYGVVVPMIFAGPSVVNPNRVCTTLINTVDIFATIVENFGFDHWQTSIPLNKPTDSKSIQPIIKNVTDNIRPWSFSEIFKLSTDDADGKAMRNSDYKLIHFDNGKEEFYHLALDPDEQDNLLTRSLTEIEKMNYIYLCNEMTKLVGGTSFCNSLVDVTNTTLHNEIKILPNPVNNYLHIDDDFQGSSYEVMDIYGRKIFETRSKKIDVSSWQNGVYFLLVNNGKAFKFIKY